MIFDSDVIIWFLKRSVKALATIREIETRYLSILSYMELIQGAHDAREMATIKLLLAEHEFQILPLSENIGHRAAVYLEEYTLRSGLKMVDALIAATAAELDLQLCTANRKHFRAIQDLNLKVFRP